MQNGRGNSGWVTTLTTLALTAAVVVPFVVRGARSEERPAEAAAQRSTSEAMGRRAASRPAPLPPLAAESWRIELPVEGFEPAVVSVPLGATEPRPVVIALHGMADKAEWQCGTWRGITDGYPFVLCPRGQRLPQGTETYGSHAETERELRAALAALKQRFGRYVAPGSALLAGFSLGAAHAVALARQEPAFFSPLVLVEGGAKAWSSTLAAIYREGGGQRLLFVCAQPACLEPARIKQHLSTRAGLDARVLDAGALGHVFDGRVAAAIQREFGWLVQGDARYGALAR